MGGAGFDPAGLGMSADLGDPRRQSRLLVAMQHKVNQLAHLMQKPI